MFSHIHFQIETVFILAAAALLLQWVRRLNRRMAGNAREHATEDDLYEMPQTTDASESEIR